MNWVQVLETFQTTTGTDGYVTFPDGQKMAFDASNVNLIALKQNIEAYLTLLYQDDIV